MDDVLFVPSFRRRARGSFVRDGFPIPYIKRERMSLKMNLLDTMNLLKLGGPVVLVLLVMSVVGLAVVFYKLIQYRRYSSAMINRVDRAVNTWAAGDAKGALALLEREPGPFGQLLLSGMSWLASGAPDEEKIREELTRRGQKIMAQVNGLNPLLEQIAYLAPLLGLLGTVLGIIDVFHGLASDGGGADTGILAGGIWEALLTTAVGLVVAIPFALLHAILDGRAIRIRGSMEDQITRLFTVDLYRQGTAARTEK